MCGIVWVLYCSTHAPSTELETSLISESPDNSHTIVIDDDIIVETVNITEPESRDKTQDTDTTLPLGELNDTEIKKPTPANQDINEENLPKTNVLDNDPHPAIPEKQPDTPAVPHQTLEKVNNTANPEPETKSDSCRINTRSKSTKKDGPDQ